MLTKLTKAIVLLLLIKLSATNLCLGQTDLHAAFYAGDYTITAGECIDFYDMSVGNPTYWKWSFPGSEIPVSYLRNPVQVCYLVPGTYDVALEVQNSTNVSQEYIPGLITVLENNETPIANFTSDYVIIQQDGFVRFEDISQNDPVQWHWTFEGGDPETSTLQNPFPINYENHGSFDVKLRIVDADGQENELLRENYIKVIPNSFVHPTANFIADRIYISPGEAVSFTDLTTGNPHSWEWEFEGAAPGQQDSRDANPISILYPTAGIYDVKLVVENNLSTDTLIRENYIVVSTEDTCSKPPTANFKSTQRLIRYGQSVYFEDLSEDNPTAWNWYFEGGYPEYSSHTNPINGVQYSSPGVYKVSLSASNVCGDDIVVRHDYIFVFSGTIPKYCDTISNIASGERLTSQSLDGTWGHIGGHNGQRIRTYADKFDQHSFTKIEGLIVPVEKSEYVFDDAFVTFYVWDGNTTYPDSVLAEKKVLIRNLNTNFHNYVKFEYPVEVDGPFFVGYRINYNDVNGDGQSDDRFSVSTARNRTSFGAKNTLYVERAGEWFTATERFNVRTSSAIRPVACIVDISELTKDKEKITLYPNPANNYIKLDLGDIKPGKDIRVSMFDITGRLIFQKNTITNFEEIELNISDYPEGLYFINLNFEQNNITRKIMIAR